MNNIVPKRRISLGADGRPMNDDIVWRELFIKIDRVGLHNLVAKLKQSGMRILTKREVFAKMDK